jgi:hypothetical protein
MRRLLKAQLRVWHIVAVLLVISVMTTGAVLARGGDPASRQAASHEPRSTVTGTDFWPSGKTRIVTSTSNDTTTVNPGGDQTVLTASFRVPSHQRADVVALYNGDGFSDNAGGYCYLEFRLDSASGPAFSPGEEFPVDGQVYSNHYPTLSVNGVKKNIGAGHHTVYVTMDSTGPTCDLWDQSLVLLANVR